MSEAPKNLTQRAREHLSLYFNHEAGLIPNSTYALISQMAARLEGMEAKVARLRAELQNAKGKESDQSKSKMAQTLGAQISEMNTSEAGIFWMNFTEEVNRKVCKARAALSNTKGE